MIISIRPVRSVRGEGITRQSRKFPLVKTPKPPIRMKAPTSVAGFGGVAFCFNLQALNFAEHVFERVEGETNVVFFLLPSFRSVSSRDEESGVVAWKKSPHLFSSPPIDPDC